MIVGINISNFHDFEVHTKIIKSGEIDFVELLIDNMIGWNADDIRGLIGDIPVAFHIMNSQFLESPTDRLDFLASKIRGLIDGLNPLYVSDHVIRFTSENRQTPMTMEVYYEEEYQNIENLVKSWSEKLGSKLLLENFPSSFSGFGNQIDFFRSITKLQQVGLLFDLSNCFIAQLNTQIDTDDWELLSSQAQNFHIAGYRTEEEQGAIMTVDTHDKNIDPNCFNKVMKLLPKGLKDASIVVERDSNINFEDWMKDIALVSKEVKSLERV